MFPGVDKETKPLISQHGEQHRVIVSHRGKMDRGIGIGDGFEPLDIMFNQPFLINIESGITQMFPRISEMLHRHDGSGSVILVVESG